MESEETQHGADEGEDLAPESFRMPKGMQRMPRPNRLDGGVVGLQIVKHWGDFGWAIGRIKGFQKKRNLPFNIKWRDEAGERDHKLVLGEYIELRDVQEAKAGDFMILTKETGKGSRKPA